MRISDWSSDVCSSDLRTNAPRPANAEPARGRRRSAGLAGASRWRTIGNAGRVAVEGVAGQVMPIAINRLQRGRERGVVPAEVGVRQDRLAVDDRELVRVEPELRALGPIFMRCRRAILAVPQMFGHGIRSEEHTSELQSLMRISY